MKTKILKDKREVAHSFAIYFKALVDTDKEFHVALSGGSTPKVVFDVLASDHADSIDWSKIHFYWGDERCVSPIDDQSNYKMTVDHLFSKVPIPQENIHRILGENEPQREAMRYANLLEINLDRINGTPQFDLVILGMGDDGHTASIFPHQLHLWNANDHCVVAEHPQSGQRRISITGNLINNAKEVAFLVTGKSKAEKIAEIHTKTKGHTKYPAALVKPSLGKLVWFLDQDAASLIVNDYPG